MFVNVIDKHVVHIGYYRMAAVYLDCNATTPIEPRVRDVLLHFLDTDFGNEGSRTHEYGARAKVAVQRARDQLAALVGVSREEVIFTSGATESNNMALLGLAEYGIKENKRHIVTTSIEHKAILEPVDYLRRKGFEVTLVPVSRLGIVRSEDIRAAIRPDTLLVSVMQVNNETGAIQPLDEICHAMQGSEAYLHTDAAQGFGKVMGPLLNKRIDLISISGHKIYAPKGVGALIVRRRGSQRIPLAPLMLGGGQERGIRPGTLPVHLAVALGEAARISAEEYLVRAEKCKTLKEAGIKALTAVGGIPVGDQDHVLPSTLNVLFPFIDSEALIVKLQGIAAISNGSACTSSSYKPSHVLQAMGMNDREATRCVRFSWCHLTPEFDWADVAGCIKSLGVR